MIVSKRLISSSPRSVFLSHIRCKTVSLYDRAPGQQIPALDGRAGRELEISKRYASQNVRIVRTSLDAPALQDSPESHMNAIGGYGLTTAPIVSQPGAWRSWSALAKRTGSPAFKGFTIRTARTADCQST